MATSYNNIQIIHDENGLPAFAVIPYNDYQVLQQNNVLRKSLRSDIPTAVLDIFFENECSTVRAWREYLGLTQAEVAERIGVTQSAYSQHENTKRLRRSTREKIANALGIHPEQLNF
ncbi:MAG: helix-turn-helix transcriptional regulator [Pasteurellaceae bacterium]|nr:helix-turn-helix transcriptional regulator [Pasteurellaceae bacterium]